MALISLAGFALFVYLFSKFKDTKPAVPYFLLIGASIVLAQFIPVSMLHIDDVDLHIAAIMIFSAWKMIMGLWHVAHHGQYVMILATVSGLLVYKVGIFEGC